MMKISANKPERLALTQFSALHGQDTTNLWSGPKGLLTWPSGRRAAPHRFRAGWLGCTSLDFDPELTIITRMLRPTW